MGPSLSAPALDRLPLRFTPTFLNPDESEISTEPGTCRIFASGTLGQAPARATLDAAGKRLTLELRVLASSERLVYRGELARDPCVEELKDDEGTLALVEPSASAVRRHPRALVVSLERRRASLRTIVKGWRRADRAESVLELSEIAPALRSSYDALARPLSQHEGAAVRIARAIDDGAGLLLVAYWLASGQLKLAELGAANRVVRRSIVTGMTCRTRDCSSAITAARPRPGVVLIVAANTTLVCTSSCTGTRELELWTLGPRGFASSGSIPPAPEPSDPSEQERAMLFMWLNVDGRSLPDLLIALHPQPRETSQLFLFTFDPGLQRYALDQRPLAPTPDVLAAMRGGVIFGFY